MFFILSPAKKLATHVTKPDLTLNTSPHFLNETKQLTDILQSYVPHQLADLMHISDKLSVLNVDRFARMSFPMKTEDIFPAVLLFNGDAYEGLDASTLDATARNYLNQHLAILSGLYGLLKPFDDIYPYRLEMGTALKNNHGDNLYQFWGHKITDYLNQLMADNQQQILVNLASQEYFKAIQPNRFKCRIITPVFKDKKNDQYKTISFYAKRARGLMVRYASMNQLTDSEQLQQFDLEGYYFSPEQSDDATWVFLRD